MDAVSLSAWVSGLGSLAAAFAALYVAQDGRRIAIEARAAGVRERVVEQMTELLRVIERDAAAVNEQLTLRPPTPEGAAACRAVWGYRSQIGTSFAWYCGGEDMRAWIDQLDARNEVLPRMRQELQEAIDKQNFEDVSDAARAAQRRQRSQRQRVREWIQGSRKIDAGGV